MNIEDILKKNKTWAEEKFRQDKDYFRKLSKNKKPKILYIGCSDARVAPESILGTGLGEIFVHRNIANQVSDADPSSNAVIQCAVEVLQVKHIIVCGHYDCLGVQAVLQPTHLEKMNQWLKNTKTILEERQQEINKLSNETEKLDQCIKWNALAQANNLANLSIIKKAREKNGFPKIHAWVFNLRNGQIVDLNFSK